jgi:hypothetical protein
MMTFVNNIFSSFSPEVREVSKSLVGFPVFELKEEDRKLFNECYTDFLSYFSEVGNYCVGNEATFVYLKNRGSSWTIPQIEAFLMKDDKLKIMTEQIHGLAKKGIANCLVLDHNINITTAF